MGLARGKRQEGSEAQENQDQRGQRNRGRIADLVRDDAADRAILVFRLREVKVARYREQEAQERDDGDDGRPVAPRRKPARAGRVRMWLALAEDGHFYIVVWASRAT